jgi:hypothetical protein
LPPPTRDQRSNRKSVAVVLHLLEKDAIAKANPERGRFRAFVLTALKNFLANERHWRYQVSTCTRRGIRWRQR